jgi:hypothetical protein
MGARGEMGRERRVRFAVVVLFVAMLGRCKKRFEARVRTTPEGSGERRRRERRRQLADNFLTKSGAMPE